MLVNTQAELMKGLEGLGCADCFSTCGCAPANKGMGGLGDILGSNVSTDYQCSQESGCSALMNAWCYSAGALTDRCAAWRASLFGPPMPSLPVVPPLNSWGGTDATVDQIISGTAERQREQVRDVFGEQGTSEEPVDSSNLWLIAGALIAGVILLKRI